MNRRITVRDVAERMGVHYSTVARALKNNPRVKKSTRLKIQAEARAMGYAPDPMVSALAVYRNAIRNPVVHGTLAWLSNQAEPIIGPHAILSIRNYAEGAREQAAQLGYRIEEFPFLQEGMSPKRFVQVLRTRGITGVIVGPQPSHLSDAEIHMDWSSFSAVALGPSLNWPPLHRVSSNQFRSVKTIVHELIALGYRRIGLYVDRQTHRRMDGAWLGGYLAAMTENGLECPELLMDKITRIDEIEQWVQRNKIDAVISAANFYDFWMVKSKLKAPDDIGYASLHVMGGTESNETGINQNDREVGRAAVNLLVSMMQRQEKGIPAIPQRLLIESTWQQGMTVRRKDLRS